MIEILKETARYLVCVKPIGIAAQGTQAEAMPQLLSEQLGCDIFPVHRLDQTVGGVMVYAKTVQEAARLTQAMGQGQMQKTYLAVLTGCPAEEGRDAGGSAVPRPGEKQNICGQADARRREAGEAAL